MLQVGGQDDLGRLALQVAPRMGAAHTVPQALHGSAEELLEDIVGAGCNCDCTARLVAGHGMAGESGAVAARIAEHDALGLEAVPCAGGPCWNRRRSSLLNASLNRPGISTLFRSASKVPAGLASYHRCQYKRKRMWSLRWSGRETAAGGRWEPGSFSAEADCGERTGLPGGSRSKPQKTGQVGHWSSWEGSWVAVEASSDPGCPRDVGATNQLVPEDSSLGHPEIPNPAKTPL